MDITSKSQGIYRPIKPYQTRIVYLHGDNGVSDSPVVCTLYTADILHPKYEGLGLRSPFDEEETLIEFDALSYTWGNGKCVEYIICNDSKFAVTENLFEALRALRHSQDQARYIWVDAICVNQSDDREKGEQVRNMLEIYQKATRVVAWLGSAQKDMENALAAASVIPSQLSPNDVFDFWSIYAGMSHLYTRPWFKRVWVQQEIFAARKLRLQCGHLHFEWSQLLSNPKLLHNLPHLRPYSQPEKDDEKANKKSGGKVPDQITDQFNAISRLDKLHKHHVKCFEQFRPHNRHQPVIIDTLLDTGTLSATNPRDYIYGIVGLTGLPAKAIPLHEWTMARQHKVFLPIDYSADLALILSALTWVLLMKEGLAVLTKFKTFPPEDDGKCEQTLPSWVIDWRLSARLFSKMSSPTRKAPKKDTMTLEDIKWVHRNAATPWPESDLHKKFCDDNNDHTASLLKLVLHGTPDLRLYAKGKSVWQKSELRMDEAIWHLELDLYTTDLVVRMENSGGFFTRYGEGAYSVNNVWLLRPAGAEEFKLIAFLAKDWVEPYEEWIWDPEGDVQNISPQERSVNRCRRLTTDPETLMRDFHYEPTESRSFTII